MPSGRWKKLAIAGAILIIGIVTAWQFRHELPAETAASKMIPLPGKTETPAKTQSREAAKLAGRIEPYTSSQDKSGAGLRQPPAAPIEHSSRHAGSGAALAGGDSQTRAGQFPADFAPSASDSSPADPMVKQQTALAPNDFGSHFSAGNDKPALDRHVGSASGTSRPELQKRHKIVDGDSLPALAGRYLGNAERSNDLFEYNRDVLATADVLPIGKELRIPPADFVSPTASLTQPPMDGLTNVSLQPQPHARAPAGLPAVPTATAGSAARTYVVQPHDTLALIARKLYGDISRQSDLMAANRQQLRTPRDLRPGMTLFVPATR